VDDRLAVASKRTVVTEPSPAQPAQLAPASKDVESEIRPAQTTAVDKQAGVAQARKPQAKVVVGSGDVVMIARAPAPRRPTSAAPVRHDSDTTGVRRVPEQSASGAAQPAFISTLSEYGGCLRPMAVHTVFLNRALHPRGHNVPIQTVATAQPEPRAPAAIPAVSSDVPLLLLPLAPEAQIVPTVSTSMRRAAAPTTPATPEARVVVITSTAQPNSSGASDATPVPGRGAPIDGPRCSCWWCLGKAKIQRKKCELWTSDAEKHSSCCGK